MPRNWKNLSITMNHRRNLEKRGLLIRLVFGIEAIFLFTRCKCEYILEGRRVNEVIYQVLAIASYDMSLRDKLYSMF